MKKYIYILMFLAIQLNFAQNTYPFPENNNVGIGTNNPVSKLTINGSLTMNGGLNNITSRPSVSATTLANGEIRGYSNTANGADDGFLRLSAGGGTSPIKSFIDLSGYSTIPDMMGNIVFGTYGSERMRIVSNGNVGIGTENPSSRLSVLGGFSKLTLTGVDGTFDNVIKYGHKSDLESQTTNVNRWHGIDATITAGLASENKLKFRLYPGGFTNLAPIDVMTLVGNGNVGIGKENPTNKLDVNGTIHSQEVKVDMKDWSDFVFKKEYNLPTLEEVEKHIAEKGHLENIPSEEEVLKNGINLGKMNAKLLQKIEEMTLYIIELKKDISSLQQKNEKLTDLEKRFLILEKTIKK
ncbi:hypothetical protein [uncultured Flavobacterium sp.]|uniref:hypothetical protein n=1 Tax=uncultured Flavobacterium sp. TaxID=165435 RepID=UPI0025D309A8|nr:hypothetical protein [uncultured Flavobacterium sp.]